MPTKPPAIPSWAPARAFFTAPRGLRGADFSAAGSGREQPSNGDEMLNYEVVRHWTSGDIRHVYSTRDVMLYALGVGMGQDPMNEHELRFVTETQLQVMPTMAAVMAAPGMWMRDNPATGIDVVKLVHGEQSVTIHQALPAAGTVIGNTRVTGVVDKGEGKGAIVYTEKRIVDAQTNSLLATCESTTFCRGDGGFSKGRGADEPAPAPPATPDRTPDLVVELVTRPETALVYRLSGDYNPLHSDPNVAKAAGFPRPILHGLSTYGAACRGILAACCGHDPARLRSIAARFSSPTFPGDQILLEIWQSDNGVAFRARVPAREVTVLSHGRAVCERT
jgi:acyl dehydratase